MSKKLFFIDDDEVFLYLIERTCQKIETVEGIEFAENGEDALQKIDSWLGGTRPLPNLMFVDINMPGMDGFEFLDEFKVLREKFEELKKIVPIVMLTSSVHEQDEEKALATGIVSDFVVKPPDMEGLEKSIRKFLE